MPNLAITNTCHYITAKKDEMLKQKKTAKQTLTSYSHELDEKVHSKPEDSWHHLLIKQHTHHLTGISQINLGKPGAPLILICHWPLN